MPPTSRPGRLFAVVAWIEAFTWAGLLVGMVLKHVTGTTDAGVWLFGRLHGAAFVLFVVVTVVVGVRLRWGWFRTLVALASSVPPLTTLLAERWLERSGHLAVPSPRPARAPKPALTRPPRAPAPGRHARPLPRLRGRPRPGPRPGRPAARAVPRHLRQAGLRHRPRRRSRPIGQFLDARARLL